MTTNRSSSEIAVPRSGIPHGRRALVVLGLVALVTWSVRGYSSATRDRHQDEPGPAAAGRPAAEMSTASTEPSRSMNVELLVPSMTVQEKATRAGDVSTTSRSNHSKSVGAIKSTGSSEFELAGRLYQEFMPLMTKCIDLAKTRNPGLHGLLSFRVTIGPAANLVSVASVEPSDENQIADPDLLECLQETALSLEDLEGRHDFDFIAPIAPDGSAS